MITIKIDTQNPRYSIDELKTLNNIISLKNTPDGNGMSNVSMSIDVSGNESGILVEMVDDIDWIKYTLSKIPDCIE